MDSLAAATHEGKKKVISKMFKLCHMFSLIIEIAH